MSHWIDRILAEFPADLAHLWVAADPDDILLDPKILVVLRERGFEVLPFDDSVTFRVEYEERYREVWDRGSAGPSKALVLQLRSSVIDALPWDYFRQARKVRLSLADLFPNLSYTVVRQIDAVHLAALFDAQSKYATQSLGEAATKEFVLTHIFRIGAHLISRPEDLWRELLRLHYRDAGLPPVLASYVSHILGSIDAFKGLPIAELFTSKIALQRVLQTAWQRYLERVGVVVVGHGGIVSVENLPTIDVPFDHPDVRAIVDSMFLDGTLHPLVVQEAPNGIADWVKVGTVQDPDALSNMVLKGVKNLLETTPTLDSSHRDWTQYARRFGEILFRFHSLDTSRANAIQDSIIQVQTLADERIQPWLAKFYADLPSLPVAKSPVMVHHVPRFLALRRSAGESKIALLVFDGLAFDQWIQVREHAVKKMPQVEFDENGCFAWLPTTTSVSRQAIFSGLRPRDFPDSIETTSQESAQWTRVWQDNGLRANEVLFRKGIKRVDQLDELDAAISNPSIKVAAIVVDTVDEIVHGAILGKRGISNQIDGWCETGFIDRLFTSLLNQGFSVYLTADHGNVEAVGVGRPNQGVLAETRGERVRVYRSEALLVESANTYQGTIRMDIAGLPADFMPLYAGGRTAFVPVGEQLVVHGGMSVEELIVPFVKVKYAD